MKHHAVMLAVAVTLGISAPATTVLAANDAGLTSAYRNQTDHTFRKGLQTRLTWTGDYAGELNGAIGPASLRAIRDFQARHGMPADGVISEPMLDALIEQSDLVQRQLDVALVADADTGTELLLPQAVVIDAGKTEVGHLWRADGRALEVETVRIADTGQTIKGLYDVLSRATDTRSVSEATVSDNGFRLSGTVDDRRYVMRFVGREGDLRGFSASYDVDEATRYAPYVAVAAGLFEPFAGEPATPRLAQRDNRTLSDVIAEHSGGRMERTRYAMADTDRSIYDNDTDGGFDLPPRVEAPNGPLSSDGDAADRTPGLDALSNPEFAMAGSGFVVSRDGWIATNAHVVRGCSAIRVGTDAFAERTIIDDRNDLALIKTATAQGEPLEIVADKPRLGEDVLALGFPLRSILSDSLNVTRGNVSSLLGLMNDPRYMQFSAPIQPGNSGGPLVDLAGRVVGVVTAKLDAVAVADATGDIPQSINFAIEPNGLTDFLDAQDIDYETADPDEALASVPVATASVMDSIKPVICTDRF